ncbi:PREDICTED: DNA cross-link repair 1A protein [Chrysochloris asiatica]|uniref:DNA cross-link repair 1A protein n=1 Tax=Chrysochloris asiatica TaxID=185453 RepID=A0A9B0SYN9_CHRAS|nr:PREDICTED: DNA cross-link repair 1A protein [Chrysochloris asiatica]
MLEDGFLEDDIWEYRSKRKPKPVHPNNDLEKSPKSVEKTTDGKYKSKRSRNKKGRKRTVEAKENAKNNEVFPGGTHSKTSMASDQDSSCGESIQLSQEKTTTPVKTCRTHKNKQVSSKIRPVYDGYCPNCQMPFSALLGQTPRWHVFECLDSPQISETECPDGLLCTSTIPSHYKRYAHLLLAQSRAGTNSFGSPPCTTDGHLNCSSETESGFLGNLEKWWSPNPQKQTENLKGVSGDPCLMTQGGRRSQSATDADQKASFPTKIEKSQRALRFSEFVNNDKVVGAGLPRADEELDSSEHINWLLPENDFSNCEISYSPLQSDEETSDVVETLDDSQQELFFTENSKDRNLEEGSNSCIHFTKLPGPSLKGQEESRPQVSGFVTQHQYNEELYKCHALTDLSQLISQNNESILSCDDPAYNSDSFLLSPPALAGELDSSHYLTTKAKPDEPTFGSAQANTLKHAIGKSAVYSHVQLPLFEGETSNPFKIQGKEDLSFHPNRSKTIELSSENFNGKKNAKSVHFRREVLDGRLDSNVSVLNRKNLPSTPTAATVAKIVPSGPSAGHSSNKVMKQMDIGVYFGLPPKRKDEKLPQESALKGTDSNPVVSPSRKRSQPCKRKAEHSLSDLEFDAQSLNESQLPVEVSSERSQHQRKRRKKADSVQRGASQKSDHINNTRSGTANLSQDSLFIKAADGRQQERSTAIPELSNARGLRQRKCPFYKKIPGTGFTVDAFQYGPIEGCTAYFLTHFHSDHYAGLSKNFTSPLYCSEITGNLVKSKLHVQEQYIHPLPMDTECPVNGVRVVLLDANHCPGAVMILFYLPDGPVILHTGDFRADPSMERSLLANQKIHTLYLDTTYCSPEYSFPSQQEVIQFAINTAFEAVTLNPRALVVCGTYSIGKEKVFLAIADVLGSKVGMSQEKYSTLQCLNIPEMSSLITTDMCSALVHILPMMQVNFKGLQRHLKRCAGKYNQILAFRPTGWTHCNKLTSIADLIPQTKGNITIYGIPYSEHSSYLEMKRFVQWLRPQKIIPTVNVGTWKDRRAMETYFREWKLESGY